jgi:dinuclear metal center YbgI/SA1388 family protein
VVHVAQIVDFLQQSAPLELAAEWDNVGLLIGSGRREVTHVLTCLTLTADVAAEAIDRGAELIVTHHPVLFRSVQRLTDETTEGGMLLELIAARISVYSPHTAFDSAADGINQQLAVALGLQEIGPLRPLMTADAGAKDTSTNAGGESPTGSGRWGTLSTPLTLKQFNERVKSVLGVRHLQYVGDDDRRVERVAVACGAAAEFLIDADRHGCDVLLTGEARFHACLEAQARDLAMVLPGHYVTERPAVEQLAVRIGAQFPQLKSAASTAERDPVQWSVS